MSRTFLSLAGSSSAAAGLCLLAACADGDLPTQSSKLNDVLEAVEMSDLYETADGMPLAVQADESSAIYAQDRLPTFRITLSESALMDLAFEPREYVAASLELIEGDASELLEPVGVKLKGQGSFRTLEGKAAFRIKIDKYNKTQNLHGVEDLTLNNMIQDGSMLAERMAYHVYRELGAPAPRANHALVYVNDVFFGVYANIETPNEEFLASWFQNSKRNMYEQGGRDFDQPDSVSSFELETNEALYDDRENLQALHEACAAFDLPRARELVDWPKFLLYSALEAAVNQVDGYSYAQSFPNNFRIYDSDDGFVFIPWGMDWAFGNVRTQDGSAYVDPFWVRPTHGVLMRMCLADLECISEYIDVLHTVASRWDELTLPERLDEWSAQIDEAFQLDERHTGTKPQVIEARSGRRAFLEGRAASLFAVLQPRE